MQFPSFKSLSAPTIRFDRIRQEFSVGKSLVMQQRPKSVMKSERWITINSDHEGGGTHIKIDDSGKIVGGPKELADKGIHSLGDFGKSDKKQAANVSSAVANQASASAHAMSGQKKPHELVRDHENAAQARETAAQDHAAAGNHDVATMHRQKADEHWKASDDVGKADKEKQKQDRASEAAESVKPFVANTDHSTHGLNDKGENQTRISQASDAEITSELDKQRNAMNSLVKEHKGLQEHIRGVDPSSNGAASTAERNRQDDQRKNYQSRLDEVAKQIDQKKKVVNRLWTEAKDRGIDGGVNDKGGESAPSSKLPHEMSADHLDKLSAKVAEENRPLTPKESKRSKVTIQQAHAKLDAMGYKLGEGHTDLKKKETSYKVTGPDGQEKTMTTGQIHDLIEGGGNGGESGSINSTGGESKEQQLAKKLKEMDVSKLSGSAAQHVAPMLEGHNVKEVARHMGLKPDDHTPSRAHHAILDHMQSKKNKFDASQPPYKQDVAAGKKPLSSAAANQQQEPVKVAGKSPIEASNDHEQKRQDAINAIADKQASESRKFNDKNDTTAFTPKQMAKEYQSGTRDFSHILKETGVYTDGNVLIKPPEKMKEQILGNSSNEFQGFGTHKLVPQINQMITDASRANTQQMRPIGERTVQDLDKRGKGSKVIDRHHTLLSAADGTHSLVDSKYVRTIQKMYPDATYHEPASKHGPVIVKNGGDTVGVLMPLSGDEGKQDSEISDHVKRVTGATKPVRKSLSGSLFNRQNRDSTFKTLSPPKAPKFKWRFY